MNAADLFPELKRLVERYRDSYTLDDKVKALCREKFDGKHSTFLWAAFRAGEVDLAREERLYNVINDEADAFDADDFVKWVEAMEANFPKAIKDYGGYTSALASSDDLPGDVYPMGYLIQMKAEAEDKAFAEAMRGRWAQLPEPWRTGVAWNLAKNGLLPWPEVPEDALYEVSKKLLKTEHLPDDLPMDRLGPIMVKAAADPEVESFEYPVVFSRMLPYTDTATLIGLMGKARYNWHLWEAIEALDALPDEALPLLRDAFASLKIGPKDYDKPWPAFLLAFTYLRHCQRHGVVPDAELDGQFESLFSNYEQGWSGSGEAEHRRKIRELIRLIPTDRLEALVLAPKEIPWTFVGACNTPDVRARITSAILGLPGRPDYNQQQTIEAIKGSSYEKHADSYLYDLAGDLAPHFSAPLADNRGNTNSQLVMLTVLSFSGAAEAAEGAAAALGSTSKQVREAAEAAVSQLPPEAVEPHIIKLLGSGRKDARLTAACALAGLPPSEAAYAAAQARLAKEKVAAVKDALAMVRAPAGGQEDDSSAELIAALEESEGARWVEFKDMGPKLAHVYTEYLAQQFRDSRITTYEDEHERWLEVFTAFSDDADVRRRALELTPCYTYYGDDYLTALCDACEAIEGEIAHWALTSGVKRPPELGKLRGSSFGLHEVVKWARCRNFEAFIPLQIKALADKRAKVRKDVVGSLAARPEVALPALHDALATTEDANIRAGVVEILAKVADPSSLAPLQALKAKVGDGDSALNRALAQVQAASLDVDAIEDDAALDAALAALPASEPPYGLDPKAMPRLCWGAGAKLSDGAQAWVLGALGQESLERTSVALRRVARRLDLSKSEPFIDEILQKGYSPFSGWQLFAQAILGGPNRVADIVGKLDELASSQRTKWGDEGVEALVRNGSDAAIRGLDTAHRKTRRDALRWRSAAGLSRMAEARGMTSDDLVDSAMSDCGFDGEGRQTLDYGPRAMTLQLDEDLNIQIFTDAGKQVKSLPAARKDDDADKVKKAKAYLTATRKEMKQIQKVQPRRLEDALASQRLWPAADWAKRFAHHPLMRTLGRRLVWEALDAQGSSAGTFRLRREDGGAHVPVDLKGDPVAIPEGGAVRLQHPIHLTAEQREAWKEALWDAKERPLFVQMERRIFTPDDLPPDADLFTRLPRATVSAFLKGLNACGYERGAREDAGMICSSYRSLGEYNVALSHGDVSYFDASDVEIEGVHVTKGDDTIPWRSTPAVIFSELARDIHEIVGG